MSDDHSEKPGFFPQQAANDNERLVRSIAQGDREAEREFALRYLRPVRAMLLARSRNPDLAADLQQEVMIQAICELRRGHLREPAKLTAFVIGIARNLLNSHYRAAARQPQSLDLPNDIPDLSPASDQAEEAEREKQTMHAISSLATLDKTILQIFARWVQAGHHCPAPAHGPARKASPSPKRLQTLTSLTSAILSRSMQSVSYMPPISFFLKQAPVEDVIPAVQKNPSCPQSFRFRAACGSLKPKEIRKGFWQWSRQSERHPHGFRESERAISIIDRAEHKKP